ncbi:MAG TPA: hypothetical protein VEA38_03145 [Terriglobales bacterium]|nr:hypothetical protein [Terriglobales bacterium]
MADKRIITQAPACPPGYRFVEGAGMFANLIAWLKQFTNYNMFAQNGQLTPHDYRSVAITLRSRVTNTTDAAAPPNTDAKYRVPDTHNLVIRGIRGYVAPNDPDGSNETLAVGNLGNLELVDRMRMKANNCRATLVNNDLNENLFEYKALPLGAITPDLGGKPLDWSEAPTVIMGGQTLQMDITFLDTASAIIGASTDYGLVLDAILVRRRTG